MKQLYYILLAVMLCSMTGIRADAQKSVYSFPFENQSKLPAMEVFINRDALADTYQTYGAVLTSQYTGPDEETSEEVSTAYVNNEKIVDAMRFLEHYAFDQLLTYNTEKKGTVELKVTYYNLDTRLCAGSILSFATLGFAMFFGSATNRNFINLEVEAVFYDKNGNYLTRYTGIGHGSASESLYRHRTRKAHQKALVAALSDLNRNIMGDSNLMVKLGI